MRIAHLNLFDFNGGAAQVSESIIAASDAAGHESFRFIHVPSRPDARTLPLPHLGGPYRRFAEDPSPEMIPHIHATPLLPFLTHPAFATADIIHLHCINRNYFSYLLLPFLAAKPLVWTIHDTMEVTAGCLRAQHCEKWKTEYCAQCPLDDSEHLPGSLDKRYMLQKYKELILQTTRFTAVAPSRWMEGLLRESPFCHQDVRLIYNGIDIETFFPEKKQKARQILGLPQDRKIVLFVAPGGVLNEMKGGKYLGEVMFQAKQRGEDWLLMEVGIVSEQIQRPFETLLVPYVTDPQMMALFYAAADVFVSTSLSENCPLVVMEALACGIPSIVFPVGGSAEIVEHDHTGFVVSMGSVNDLYAKLKLLLDSPQLAAEFGLNARKRAEALFSVKMMGEKYLRLYSELAAKK